MYQIYLFNSIISDCNKHLKKLKYIAKYKNYASFTIFSLLVAGMQSAKVKFGVKDFTDTLNTFMENNDYLNIIEKSVQRAYRIVDSHFNNTAKAHRAKTGEVLSTNNFFRNQSFVDKILRPQHVAEVAKTLKKMF